MWHRLVWLFSCEWMLKGKANGGSLVLGRAIFVSVLLYLGAIGFRDAIDPARTWVFDAKELQLAIYSTLPWFGAIIAGVYAGFYTRFSSQWTYLAGVYNQIKAIEAQVAASTSAEQAKSVIAQWKAGFIEDADALHMSKKPMIKGIINAWIIDSAVQEQLKKLTSGGATLLSELNPQAKPVTKKAEATNPEAKPAVPSAAPDVKKPAGT